METSRVVTLVKVIAMAKGEAPSITVRKRTIGMGDVTRHFTLVFPVPDLGLFQRLLAQVYVGDEIEATVVNEWHETGRVTFLEDFRKLTETGSAHPAKELASQAA
jgi:hypothetical protein